MNRVEKLVDLYDHMAWAEAILWRAVLASEPAREDERVRTLLHHLHVVQQAFYRLWTGSAADRGYPTFDDMSEMMAWGREGLATATGYLRSLDEERLAAAVAVPWAAMIAERIGREPETATVEDTATQVALHTAYHRAQINTRLRELGGAPPLVDYIAWVWLGRPAPDWPDAGSQ
jgi:uncharacterized damage-inducible protein DinB